MSKSAANGNVKSVKVKTVKIKTVVGKGPIMINHNASRRGRR